MTTAEEDNSNEKGRATVTPEEDNSNDQSRKLSNFDAVIKYMALLNPTILLRQEEIKQKLISSDTPVHPPYASMIERAITELNEEEGSSKEAISKFIEANYQDLPLAHSAFLSHHLSELVKKGDIFLTRKHCYKVQAEVIGSRTKLKHRKKNSRQKQRRPKIKAKGGHYLEQQNIVTEVGNQTHIEDENGIQRHQPDDFEDQHESQEEYIVTSENQKQVHTKELQIEVFEKQTQAQRQPAKGMDDDQNLADESLAHKQESEFCKENDHACWKSSEGIEGRGRGEELHIQPQVIEEQSQSQLEEQQVVVIDKEDELLLIEMINLSAENNQAQVKRIIKHRKKKLKQKQVRQQNKVKGGESRELQNALAEVDNQAYTDEEYVLQNSEPQVKKIMKHRENKLKQKQVRQQNKVKSSESQEQQISLTEVNNQSHAEEENWVQRYQPDEFEDQHLSREECIEVLKEGKNRAEQKNEATRIQPPEEVEEVEIVEEESQPHDKHTEEVEQIQLQDMQIKVIDGQHQVCGQLDDDQNEADERLAHMKETEVSIEYHQAQEKGLERIIENKKQAEKLQVEVIRKEKEQPFHKLIEEEINVIKKDQMPNEQKIQLVRQETGVLEEWNQSEGEHDVTEAESQEQVENEPIEEQIEDIEEHVQPREMHVDTVENWPKRQEQQNEVTEEQNRLREQQMEVCHQILDLSYTMKQLTEKNEAHGTTENSTLSHHKLDHSGSLLLSKEGCMELLKKANKIQEQLIELFSSFTVSNVAGNNSFQPMVGEEKFSEEPLLTKSSYHGSECIHYNRKRPAEAEITTLLDFNQKREKQSMLCSQYVTPKFQSKPVETASDVYVNPSLKQALQGMSGDMDRIMEFNSTTVANTNIEGAVTIPVQARDQTSFPALMEIKENDQEQQSVLPRKERLLEENEMQQQQQDVPNVLTVEKEVTISDVTLNIKDVLNDQPPNLLQLETCVHHQLLVSERPQQVGLIADQPSEGKQQYDEMKKPECEERHVKKSIAEWPREHEWAAVSQPLETEQQRLTQQQKWQLQPWVKNPFVDEVTQRQQRRSSHRTAVESDLSMPLASLKLRLKHGAEPPLCKVPQDRRPNSVGELSMSSEKQVNHDGVSESPHTQQKQQLVQGSGQVRITSARAAAGTAMEGPFQPEVVLGKAMTELSEPQQQGQETPKSNSDLNNTEGHLEQQKPLCQGRGRPPKVKPCPDASKDALLPLQPMDRKDEKQVQRRGQGRPPKIKRVAVFALSPPQNMDQQENELVKGQRQGRTPKSKQPINVTEDSLSPLQRNSQQPEQQPQSQGNGRPTKSDPFAVTVEDTLLP